MGNAPAEGGAGSVATGFPPLDAALGIGGLPRGHITELFGSSASGKTTLALQAAAHAQQAGLSAAWIDAEHGFDPAYAAALGVATDRLPVVQPDSAEEALEIARQLTVSDAVDLLIVDSAAALVPSLELRIGLGDGGPGLQGRTIASGLRKLARAVTRTETAVLFLNQMRSSGDPADPEAETTAGGPSLKMYAALRIALIPAAGNLVRFRVLKNKAGAAYEEGQLRLKSP